MMHIRIFCFVALLLSLPCNVAAQQQKTTVALLDGQIKLALPSGFKKKQAKNFNFGFATKAPTHRIEMLSEELFVFTDEPRSVTVAISFFGADELGSKANAVVAEVMPDLGNLVETRLNRASKTVEWRKRETVTMGGAKWVRLLYSLKNNTDSIVTDLYLTDFQGFMLAVNVTTPTTQYEKNKDVLVNITKSLRINADELGLPAGLEIPKQDK